MKKKYRKYEFVIEENKKSKDFLKQLDKKLQKNKAIPTKTQTQEKHYTPKIA